MNDEKAEVKLYSRNQFLVEWQCNRCEHSWYEDENDNNHIVGCPFCSSKDVALLQDGSEAVTIPFDYAIRGKEIKSTTPPFFGSDIELE